MYSSWHSRNVGERRKSLRGVNMEDELYNILSREGISTAGTLLALVGFSMTLIKRLVVGERDRLQKEAVSNASAILQLQKRVEALEEMNVTNMQRVSLLTERDEARAAEYANLKTRIDTLDNRLDTLSRDLHTGISEIKTLIIHQRQL